MPRARAVFYVCTVCVSMARWCKRRKRKKPRQPQRVGYRPLLSEEESEWVSIEMEPLVEAGPGAESHQSSDA